MSGGPRRRKTDRIILILTAVIAAMLIASLVYCYFALDSAALSQIFSVHRAAGQQGHADVGPVSRPLFEFFENPPFRLR